MPDSSDIQLDRYLAGELSVPEQRELARAALDDEELFDALTAAALVKATILRHGGTERVEASAGAVGPAKSAFQRAQKSTRIRSFKPTGLAFTVGAVAVAAAAVIAFVIVGRSSPRIVPLPTTAPAPTITSSGATGQGESRRVATRPVILAVRLDGLAGHSPSEFRSVDADSRSPKSEGVVVSVDQDEAVLDLGSLDGIVKGSMLQVFRGRHDAAAVGRLTIATVFRERSRGRATSGTLQVGDRIEIAPAMHLAALLEQVEARITAGNSTEALAIAERAVASSVAPGTPSNLRRRALDRLGTLEHRAGSFDDAARHLRLAVDDFDAAPAATPVQRATILNELGAVLIARGDYVEAERILRVARPLATGAPAAHVTNNLAALAALRGDRAAADAMYRSALALAGGSPDLESDRRAIEKNLEDLKAQR
jgi:Flp pilus assembly protein TadD